MREILYRAKRMNNDEWVYGFYFARVMENYLLSGRILASNQNEFAFKLQRIMYDAAQKIAAESTMVLAIQFRDVDYLQMEDYIWRTFPYIDGKFLYDNDLYYTHEELQEKINPYCKDISISVLPKKLDANCSDKDLKSISVSLSTKKLT